MPFKRIWVISEIYYPVKTSTGYYMTEIAEYLARYGMEVHVICTNAICNPGEVKGERKEEIHNGVHIHRCVVHNTDKNNFLKRTFRLAISSILLFKKTVSLVGKGDDLLVVTNPAFFLLFMPCIKRWKKVSYTILVHDIFPENLVAIKKMYPHSLIYKSIKKCFDNAYSKSRYCISIGRDMSTILLSKVGQKNKVKFIPIWAETEVVYPLYKKDTDLYTKLGLGDKFVFQFAGNLGNAQGIDNVLEAIMNIGNPNIHFLFIGDGAKFETIRRYCNKYDNATLIGFQDREQQNDFLNACDVAIVTLSEGMCGLGVPSKSYNIMASGKPILMIGESNSEIALCVNEHNLGWVVEPNNSQKLKDTIQMIYAHQEQLPTISNNARCIAETIYAKKMILNKYYQLFNK